MPDPGSSSTVAPNDDPVGAIEIARGSTAAVPRLPGSWPGAA